MIGLGYVLILNQNTNKFMNFKFFLYIDFISLSKSLLPTSKVYPNSTIVVVATLERYSVDEVNKLLYFLSNTVSSSLVLLDECLEPTELDIPSNVKIMYVPYFVWKSYYRIFKTNQLKNKDWNPNSKTALLLLGKTYKENRIGLLYKFYEKNSLDSIQWSLYSNSSTVLNSRKFLPKELTEEEYKIFLNTVDKKLDNILIELDNGSMHYAGFPYDVSLYTNTSLSIVSETEATINYVSTQQHTEKIYRPIFNKHPFIVASNPNYLKSLRKKGYRTFDNYLKVEYDSCEHIWDRMSKIVDNTNYFLSQLEDSSFVSDVQKDIEYNYDLLMDTTKKLDTHFTETFGKWYSLGERSL